MVLASKPAPLGEAEIAAEIKGALRLIESDDPTERETGQNRLGRLGFSALAQLEPYLRAGDPEVRGRVAAAMDRIHGTDPLFLARPSLRLTSVHLKKSPLKVALSETFRPFLVSPEVETHVGGEIPTALTLDLDHATFWEAILGFKSVTSAFFVPERLLFCDHSAFGRFSLSKADGPFLSAGYLERDDRKAVLRIRILMEPGWLPIDATFSISSIRDADGKDVLPLFENHLKEDLEAKTFGEEVERRPPDHGSACPTFLVASLKADSGKLPVGVRLTVQGIAKVRIPTAVQSAEFRIQGFKGDEERVIGEHRIRATELVLRSKDIQYKTGSSGPKGWKPPQDKSYQNDIWLVVADDEGRSIYRGGETYSSSGTRSSGANWPFKSAPTRLCYVRPMEAEVREINVTIEGIEFAKE